MNKEMNIADNLKNIVFSIDIHITDIIYKNFKNNQYVADLFTIVISNLLKIVNDFELINSKSININSNILKKLINLYIKLKPEIFISIECEDLLFILISLLLKNGDFNFDDINKNFIKELLMHTVKNIIYYTPNNENTSTYNLNTNDSFSRKEQVIINKYIINANTLKEILRKFFDNNEFINEIYNLDLFQLITFRTNNFHKLKNSNHNCFENDLITYDIFTLYTLSCGDEIIKKSLIKNNVLEYIKAILKYKKDQLKKSAIYYLLSCLYSLQIIPDKNITHRILKSNVLEEIINLYKNNSVYNKKVK